MLQITASYMYTTMKLGSATDIQGASSAIGYTVKQPIPQLDLVSSEARFSTSCYITDYDYLELCYCFSLHSQVPHSTLCVYSRSVTLFRIIPIIGVVATGD